MEVSQALNAWILKFKEWEYMNFAKKTSPFILLVFIFGCRGNQIQNSEVETKIQKIKFEAPKNPLGFMYSHDTLILSARFSECGEFGGHTEVFKVFSKGEKYFANYFKDSVTADCPYPVDENKIMVADTTFELQVKHEKFIVEYLEDLFQQSLKGKLGSHAVDIFGAELDWRMKVWNYESTTKWNEFRKLQRKLLK